MTKQNKMLPKTNKQKIKVREMKQKDIQMLTMESRQKKKNKKKSHRAIKCGRITNREYAHYLEM